MTALARFILNCLSTYYLIEASSIDLLPLGADMNASIFKAQTRDQKTYFVKVKRNCCHDTPIAILELLQKAGIQQLIAPIQTVEGKQILQLNDFTLIVYPFISGHDGFSRPLTDKQWITLGQALRRVHEVEVPANIRIRREDFSSKWRDVVRSLYTDGEERVFSDEIALNLWTFLQENKSTIQQIADRSEQLSQKACNRPLKFVLCHSDMHGGNVLIDGKGALYMIDWDDPIMAPKERDLMFIGGGVGNVWNKPYEERLFYQGYGHIDVDKTLLAYTQVNSKIGVLAKPAPRIFIKPIGWRARDSLLTNRGS
jgi:spectinomycin phosphotransferase